VLEVTHNDDDILVSGDKVTRLTPEMAIDLARDLVEQAEEFESREHVLFLDTDNGDDAAEVEVALALMLAQLQRNNAPLNYSEIRNAVMVVEKWAGMLPKKETTPSEEQHHDTSGDDADVPIRPGE